MNGLKNLIYNTQVRIALIVDAEGLYVDSVLSPSEPVERVTSSIRASELLAHGLTRARHNSRVRTLQLTTGMGHLVLMTIGAGHYLVVLAEKSADMGAVYLDMLAVVADIRRELEQLQDERRRLRAWEGVDAQEIIAAVSAWLQAGAPDISPPPSYPLRDLFDDEYH